eukprot:CAMPEP_0183466060 /NCGR_PEP_ID=MMETSP0370-20130417/148298_1 /TAXON_ID=268820 /ORGANISM="Peridinium aciculiferum, Strain PAER-2" /LENGTH=79 /DNA_ID=CAMNT_0025658309 /DNA_START=21 /DNA_END=257 /DNA_ORIENTATION=+
MLPLLYHDIVATPLRDYVVLDPGVPAGSADAPAHHVLLPLGLGALYNHGGADRNVVPVRDPARPYIWKWIAKGLLPRSS